MEYLKILGIAGRKRTGKDTLAKLLIFRAFFPTFTANGFIKSCKQEILSDATPEEILRYLRPIRNPVIPIKVLRMATALKKGIASIFNIEERVLHINSPEKDKYVKYMTSLGDWGREHDPLFWNKRFFEALGDYKGLVIVPDMRYPCELDIAHTTVFTNRDIPDFSNHSSEHSVDDSMTDYKIMNNDHFFVAATLFADFIINQHADTN